MGLDAVVYCDCVEKGRLLVPPPRPISLEVGIEGRPDHTNGPEYDELYDQWVISGPCPHYFFQLIHCRLGGTTSIPLIRQGVECLSAEPAVEYPILWSKVIYLSTHCGDHLTVEEVDALRRELDRLDGVGPRGCEGENLLIWNEFVGKLKGLVYAALWVYKPIVF